MYCYLRTMQCDIFASNVIYAILFRIKRKPPLTAICIQINDHYSLHLLILNFVRKYNDAYVIHISHIFARSRI